MSVCETTPPQSCDLLYNNFGLTMTTLLCISLFTVTQTAIAPHLPKILSSDAVAYIERHNTYHPNKGPTLGFLNRIGNVVMSVSLPDEPSLFDLRISKDRKFIASCERNWRPTGSRSIVTICDAKGVVFRQELSDNPALTWAGQSILLHEKGVPTKILTRDKTSAWHLAKYQKQMLAGSKLTPALIKEMPNDSIIPMSMLGIPCQLVMPEIGAVLRYSELHAEIFWTVKQKISLFSTKISDSVRPIMGVWSRPSWMPEERAIASVGSKKGVEGGGLYLAWPESKRTQFIAIPKLGVHSLCPIGASRIALLVGSDPKGINVGRQKLYLYNVANQKMSFIRDISWEKDSMWSISSLQ